MTSTSYQESNASNVARFTFYAVIILAGFIPFEDFILKFIPGPNELYFASRFISELTIYGLFAWMVLHKLMIGAPFHRTPVDVPLMGFLIVGIATLLLNLEDPKTDVLQGVLNLRPIFRYVILFYLVVNTPLSSRQVNAIIWVALLAGAGQVFLGLAQFAAGGALNPILEPRDAGVEVAGEERRLRILDGTREIGAIYGGSTDTIFYALFMNVTFAICMAKFRSGMIFWREHASRKNLDEAKGFTKSDIFVLMLLPLILLADILSYVRISQLIILAIIAMELVYWLGRSVSIFLGLQAMLLLVALLILFPPTWQGGGATQTTTHPLADLTSMFTVEYLETNLESQRLHQLKAITPAVLFNSPIYGFGLNHTVVVESINAAEPSFLSRPITEAEFQDVYWVAVLAKFGLAGLLLFIAIFMALFRAGRTIYEHSSNPVMRELGLAVMFIVFTSSIVLFFNRAFELRTFAFYLWLLPGL